VSQVYGRKLKKTAQLYFAVAGESCSAALFTHVQLSHGCGCAVVLAYRDEKGRLPCESADAKQVHSSFVAGPDVSSDPSLQLLALRDSMAKAQGVAADSAPDALLAYALGFCSASVSDHCLLAGPWALRPTQSCLPFAQCSEGLLGEPEERQHSVASDVLLVDAVVARQEILKVVSGKDAPLNNVLLYNAHEGAAVVERIAPSDPVVVASHAAAAGAADGGGKASKVASASKGVASDDVMDLS
jgi:hypothetical protein